MFSSKNVKILMKTIILHDNIRFSEPCAATIGCFDGVHRGHQMLIGCMLGKAREAGLESMVITFDRQPREVFDSSFRPQLLSTLAEKQCLMEVLGVDILLVLPFTAVLAAMSAKVFMEEVLKERLSVEVLVTGYDNRFGHDRKEGFDDYLRYGKAIGMEVVRGDEERFDDSDTAVSSSVIRQLLLEGDVRRAAVGLSRNYSLTGRIVEGEHIGHKLGFPTANIALEDSAKLIPASGAYAVWAITDGERMPAMMNIGTRPTFDGSHQTLEVHILNKDVGDIYGETMTVEFVERLRPERRFESWEALKEQLEEDRRRTMRKMKK